MKKVVIYARVSSKEQEKEGFSIPAQIKLLEEYAQQKSFEVVQTFCDAETAKKQGRANFKELIEFVKKNKSIKIILVEKTDRLTRNFHDYVLVDDLINNKDIEVHLVKENEILIKNSRSNTKLMHGFKVLLAKNFIDNLAEETSKGMMEKASQGFFPTKAPYGYLNNTHQKTIEVDPEKSKFVQKAFELYSTGNYSLKLLKDCLFKEGYIFRPSTPKAPIASLHKILKNEFYIGYFNFKGLHRIGHHAPLVSMQLFKEVQRQFKKQNRSDYTKREINYAGLITCGHCGNQVSGDIKKKKYVYYRCTHSKQKCPDPYIREEKLDEQFLKAVQSIAITQEEYDWLVQGLKDINQLRNNEVIDRTKQLNEEIQKLNSRLSRLYEDKLDDLIDEQFYRRKFNEWNEKISEHEEALSKVKKASKEQMDLGLSILEFCKDAQYFYEKLEKFERAKFLRLILSNSMLKDGILHLELRKPFDTVAEKPKKERWYPQRDSNSCRLREREVS